MCIILFFLIRLLSRETQLEFYQRLILRFPKISPTDQHAYLTITFIVYSAEYKLHFSDR